MAFDYGCTSFEVHDSTVASRFAVGELVFIITSLPSHEDPKAAPDDPVDHPLGTPKGMHIDKFDYEGKLYQHKYNPLLFLSPLHVRVAYLYGCLNLSLRKRRDCTFVFWARVVRTDTWTKWFTVHPYLDALYDPSIDPVLL